MPTYSKYAQLRTPLGPEADDVPGDLQQLADGIDPLLNLQATDENDRDARYGDAPVGTLVSLTAKEAIYRKGLTSWVPVWTGDGWVDLSWTPGKISWTNNGSKVKVVGDHFEMLFNMIYNGPDQDSNPTTGNLSDIDAGKIDVSFAPPSGTRRTETYGIYGAGITGTVAMAADGSMYIMDAWPSSTISNGSNFTWSFSGMLA